MKKHSEAFTRLVDEAKQKIEVCSIDDVKKRIDSAERINLIDVREDHEWEGGKIPGSRHIGRGIIERDIETIFPDKSVELVLYCGGGYRSALAAFNLKKMGYERVLSMEGGYRAWQEAGLSVDCDKSK